MPGRHGLFHVEVAMRCTEQHAAHGKSLGSHEAVMRYLAMADARPKPSMDTICFQLLVDLKIL